MENNNQSAELDKWKEMAYRYAAELDNMKKRNVKIIQERINAEKVDMIKNLINLFRDIDFIVKYGIHDVSIDKLKEAILAVHSNYTKLLTKYEVVELAPEAGDNFDYLYHEAIGRIIDPEKESNTIAEVIDNGYMMNETLIQPAKVIVYINS